MPKRAAGLCLVPVARTELWSYGYAPAYEVPAEARRGIGPPGAKMPGYCKPIEWVLGARISWRAAGLLSAEPSLQPFSLHRLKACPPVETGRPTTSGGCRF